MNIERRIIENLQGRVNPVNLFTATQGMDLARGAEAIARMLREGKVKAIQENSRYSQHTAVMYRLGDCLK